MDAPVVEKYNSSNVSLSWSKAKGSGYYQIARSTSKTSGFEVIKKISAKYTKTNVSTNSNVKYYYKIRACKTVDGKKICAPWSNVTAYTLR